MRTSVVRMLTAFVAASFVLPLDASQISNEQNGSPGVTAQDLKTPYTAEFRITEVKPPGDATTTREFIEDTAVDAKGRTMTATTAIPPSNDGTPTTTVHVFDPVAGTSSSWDSRTSVATVVKRASGESKGPSCWVAVPDNGSSPPDDSSDAKGKPAPAAPTGLSVRITSAKPMPVETATKDLGIEDIQGFQAHGVRVTQTIPAGAMGNNEPIVSTKETWKMNANPIGLIVREVDDDPRTGKRTRELVKLSFGEPDPGVFRPPAGYRISSQEMQEIPCGGP
jgi:hypothetical protein